RRISDTLLYYWFCLKGRRPYPAVQEIKPEDLNTIWPYCFLLQSHKSDGSQTYHYEYFGEALKTAYDQGQLEPGFLPIASPVADHLLTKYNDVLRTGLPLIEQGEGLSFNTPIVYRQCLLPLGPVNEAPDFILGGLHFTRKGMI